MSLFSRLFSNNNSKIHTNYEKSFFDLRIRINEEILIKVLPWILAGSIASGGAYTLSNIMSPYNAEPNQGKLGEQTSLVEEVD
ncbi:MAG: hypothetical protein QNJ53_26570 [Pleurocapsa sp. MO_192.B19]|nr:hypothetical protein [Pleurocapsa sp. MO_192.B19]